MLYIDDSNLIGDTVSTLPTLKYLRTITQIAVQFDPLSFVGLHEIFDFSSLYIVHNDTYLDALPYAKVPPPSFFNFTLKFADPFPYPDAPVHQMKQPLSFNSRLFYFFSKQVNIENYTFPIKENFGKLLPDIHKVNCLIAPFSRSSIKHNKDYSEDQVKSFFKKHSDMVFGLLDSHKKYDFSEYPNVIEYYGYPLADVFRSSYQVKYFLTVDCGLNILARELKIANHILFMPQFIIPISANPYAKLYDLNDFLTWNP